MVRSPSTSKSACPVRVTRVEVNVNVGNFSTSRNSALLKCASRSGSRVSIEAASIDASTWDLLISASSIVMTPFTGLKCPLTLVIIICLILNSAVVWTGSMFQFVVVGCGAFALIFHSFIRLIWMRPRIILWYRHGDRDDRDEHRSEEHTSE